MQGIPTAPNMACKKSPAAAALFDSGILHSIKKVFRLISENLFLWVKLGSFTSKKITCRSTSKTAREA